MSVELHTCLRAAGYLVLLVGCAPSERAPIPGSGPPVALVAPVASSAAATEALRVLVLEPHLVPSEFGFEWGPSRPWTRRGAAVVDSALGVWRIDPVAHTEEILHRLTEPERQLVFVGAGGDRVVYESAVRTESGGPSKLIVVDVEAGTSRELLLDANESLQDVSADGRRVSSLVPTQHLDGDPFGESKLPATLRVRDLDGLGLVKEWRASSGVRFTQPGLSRMAFSRDGAHLF
ncbi:hypothetical protein EON77_05455, partial [bacterium]